MHFVKLRHIKHVLLFTIGSVAATATFFLCYVNIITKNRSGELWHPEYPWYPAKLRGYNNVKHPVSHPVSIRKLPWNLETTGFRELIRKMLYVYSTYVDRRDGETTFVRLTSLTIMKMPTIDVYCEFGEHMVKGIKRIPQNAYEIIPVAGMTISCPVPGSIDPAQLTKEVVIKPMADLVDLHFPSFRVPVTKTVQLQEGPLNVGKVLCIHGWYCIPFIQVQLGFTLCFHLFGLHFEHEFTTCAGPLFSGERLYSGRDIVEFFELQNILGSERAFVPLERCSNDALKALRFYESLGWAVLLNWTLPIIPQLTFNFAQTLAISDCLYRNMGLSRVVSFQDIDEFFIPLEPNHSIWSPEFLGTLFSNQSLAALQVERVQFSPKSKVESLKSTFGHVTPICLRRFEQGVVPSQDPKSLVRPELVLDMDIHLVHKPLFPHLRMVALSNRSAQVHHYRTCNDIAYPCNVATVHNAIMLRYAAGLQKRYNSVVELLGV